MRRLWYSSILFLEGVFDISVCFRSHLRASVFLTDSWYGSAFARTSRVAPCVDGGIETFLTELWYCSMFVGVALIRA